MNWSKSQDANSIVELNNWSSLIIRTPKLNSYYKSANYKDYPSIATAALGLGPADLMNDLKTMGFFFEAMCVRDLRVFAEALNGKVYQKP